MMRASSDVKLASFANLAEYDAYITAIDNVEEIEEVIIKDSKIKKCCFYSLELIKIGITYFKNIKYNINAKKEKNT